MQFVSTQRGAERLVVDGYDYYFSKTLANGHKSWECVLRRKNHCKARIHATDDHVVGQCTQHNHPPEPTRIEAYVIRRQVQDAALNTPVNFSFNTLFSFLYTLTDILDVQFYLVQNHPTLKN
jgi:hypothetical protein